MSEYIKYYTVKITKEALSSSTDLWYKSKIGREFQTKLAIVENSFASRVPAFKCVGPPFFHVYPQHCVIVKEEIIVK